MVLPAAPSKTNLVVKTLETEIFSFAYSSEKNCYVASDCQPVLCDEFVREIEKEVLYLRKVSR